MFDLKIKLNLTFNAFYPHKALNPDCFEALFRCDAHVKALMNHCCCSSVVLFNPVESLACHQPLRVKRFGRKQTRAPQRQERTVHDLSDDCGHESWNKTLETIQCIEGMWTDELLCHELKQLLSWAASCFLVFIQKSCYKNHANTPDQCWNVSSRELLHKIALIQKINYIDKSKYTISHYIKTHILHLVMNDPFNLQSVIVTEMPKFF